MERILIRHLPEGTRAALNARAERSHRSAEAEARDISLGALKRPPLTLVDLLAGEEGADIDFEPERLGGKVRWPW